MTKFLHYLTEGRTQSIDKDKAFKLIDKHCSKNYDKTMGNKVSKIYRGIKNFKQDFGYINSNKGELRTSANTLNYVTLLIDNLPSWKDYPKRSKGIICSTDEGTAYNYGETYQVFPYDNSKIGICPEHDMWDSFYNTFKGHYIIPDINELLKNTFKYYDIKVDDNNWNSFKNGLEKLDLGIILKDEFYEAYYQKLAKILFETNKNIIQHLNDILSPIKNNFRLGIDNVKTYTDNEIWIQGECIFMRT